MCPADCSGARTAALVRPRPWPDCIAPRRRRAPSHLTGGTVSMNLDGQSAIVTGAASGMGAATAAHLAARNVRVALMDVNEAALAEAARNCGGIALACDVTDAASMESAVTRAVDELGAPRILVNCAAIAPAARIVGRGGPMDL